MPNTIKSIKPGIKKSGKGECFKMDKGKPPINFPEGEIIKKMPPPKAPNPRNANKAIKMFLVVIGFIR